MTEIIFFTSSRIKLAHAQYLCRDYNVKIVLFREKTFRATYDEPRISDREKLIDLSYKNALERWSKAYPSDDTKFFIIEDTSVIIRALSAEYETPGLDVKYWMERIDFQTLDAQLKAVGSDRCVTVRSDLILHLPLAWQHFLNNKRGYEWFTGCATGTVTRQERVFNTNPMYPWLDNQTFNKWFVPDGHTQPISMLPIEEATIHDFRAQAFKQMLQFLEHHKAISRRSIPLVQKSFIFDPFLYIVCGPTCAGKTTLAEYLRDQYGYYHIEASDFMHLSYYQRHGASSMVPIGDFAQQALSEQPEIVAEQILKHIKAPEFRPVVITGFRSSDEIEWFCRSYSGKSVISVIYVNANENIRYERSIARGREDGVSDIESFRLLDTQQSAMGLAQLEKQLAANTIINESDLASYFNKFRARYAQDLQIVGTPATNSKQPSTNKLEYLILLVLEAEWENRRYFTTAEIARLVNLQISHLGKAKNKNNVSRYFNRTYHPYFELKVINGKKRYRLSHTGYSKAQLLMKVPSALQMPSHL